MERRPKEIGSLMLGSGIFRKEISKVFAGLHGCITIHDNILVFNRDEKDNNNNLKRKLER